MGGTLSRGLVEEKLIVYLQEVSEPETIRRQTSLLACRQALVQW